MRPWYLMKLSGISYLILQNEAVSTTLHQFAQKWNEITPIWKRVELNSTQNALGEVYT